MPWAVVPLFGIILAAIELCCLSTAGRMRVSDWDLIIYAIWVNTVFVVVVAIFAMLLETGTELASLTHPGQGLSVSFLAGVVSGIAIILIGFSWYRHSYPEQPYSHPSRKRASLGFVGLGLLTALAVGPGGILGVFNIPPILVSLAVPILGAIALSAICLPLILLREVHKLSASTSDCSVKAGVNGADKNLILLTVDCLRADAVERVGEGSHFKRLIADGSYFPHALVAEPFTTESLASILTSVSPAEHGVMHLVNPLPARFTTMGELLSKIGYRTAAVIGWPVQEPAFTGLGRGFQSNIGAYPNRPAHFDRPYVALLLRHLKRIVHYLFLPGVFDEVVHFKRAVRLGAMGDATRMTDAILDCLRDEDSSRPFFVWAHYIDLHPPWRSVGSPTGTSSVGNSPTDGRRSQEWESYRNALVDLDKQLGRLMDCLDKADLSSSTLLVLTGDHGIDMGDHVPVDSTSLVDNLSDTLAYPYDSVVCVPLIFWCPGLVHAGQRLEDAVQAIDIMPTILELLEVPASEWAHQARGRSLAGRLQGTDTGQAGPSTAFSQTYRGAICARTHEWKFVRTARGKRALYDLKNDPGEQTNVASQAPDVASTLERRLDDWLAAQRSYASGRWRRGQHDQSSVAVSTERNRIEEESGVA